MRLRALGRAVRESRKAKKLTQEELAERSGLHATFISRLEGGLVNVSFDSIDRVARALKMQPSWLLDKADL